ncbi:MAG TPA: alginate lyase family protein [Candidatus Binatia bacterium]
MNLQRLRTMGIAEIACRGRQEASKWIERVGINGHGSPHAVLDPAATDPAFAKIESRLRARDEAGRLLRRRFQETAAKRFFAGATGAETSLVLREKMSDACARTIAAADQICRGRFDLLGYRGLSFGDPIDWHLDPLSGQRSPLIHWSRLDPLDSVAVGDSKVVWELNRHQWLVHLGVAYRLTHDAKYAGAFAAHLIDWMRANPAGAGINWASSLEAALRIIAWSWALFLFGDAEELAPELFASMLEGVSPHAAHVEKYLSHYFAPNTHLTGEALGLFYAGVLFPELQGSGRWRELGARILIEQSERQILADGVYFEQSTCYQRYTAEIYLHFLILAERNGFAVPASVRERVERLLDFLLAVRRPDGSLPQIGDADGGWLLPLAVRAPDDCRGVFALAAAFFSRPDYASAAGGPAPEPLWLLGPAGLKKYQSLRPAPPKTESSRVFSDGGYVVMRNGWTKDAHQLLFDVGPLSSPKSGHGHADLLSIQCSVFGEPYLVDPGTFCYTADLDARDFFRGTAAHNTVLVDGKNQAVANGPFKWNAHPRARLRRWTSTKAYDLADAEHGAYRDLLDPVTHRRRVVFVKPRYWVIVDDLQGTADHRIELRFQFAPLKAALDPKSQWVRARGQRGQALLIRPFASVPLQMDLIEGNLTPLQGWVSPDYGRRVPAPLLMASAEVRLPLRIITLLFPLEHASAPCPDVLPLLGGAGGPAGLLFRRERERIVFRENSVVILRSVSDVPHAA